MLMIIITTTHQTVIYEFNANSNNIDGWGNWQGYSYLNTCGGIRYFGSTTHYYEISRIFLDLEPHSHFIVDAQFLSIDNYNQPYIEIDFMQQSYGSVKSSLASICGDSHVEYLLTISITLQHNRRTGWIYIKQNYGGLISLKLSIIKCQYECDGCIHAFCLQWKLHQYSFNQKYFTSSDGWTVQSQFYNYFACGGCQFLLFSQIKYYTQLPPHQDILIRFFKVDQYIIIVDYLYDKQTVSKNYFIEILIKNHHDPILQLNINTHIPSEQSKIRDFEVFYTQPEGEWRKFILGSDYAKILQEKKEISVTKQNLNLEKTYSVKFQNRIIFHTKFATPTRRFLYKATQ
ncbi:unnamed protein product [Paramecium octaurelia]|uniref:Uncharacterized protein n=1 Tax=Paramecium octaurelia TaxID=43137 RepID=A0A8S1XC68_PAROT|nr:unnamed protein product [Paramecium octaurelia]